jgi:hypothetical protein
MLSQTITQTASLPSQSGSDRIYCTHPNVYKHPKWPAYRAIAQISHRSGKRATADVVVINPCLAAIDKCLDAVLGSGWYTISFEWADTSF